MRRLRVGVVGGGVGAQHIDSWQALPDLFEVAAVCDLDLARAARVAAAKNIATTAATLDDLLALDLDIVDICTPSNLHFDHAQQVLAAGRHAVVEKPVARSLAEIDALRDAEAKSGKRLMPVFQYRFANGLRKLQHLQAKGFAQKAYVATVETHWRRTKHYYDNPWRGRWAGEIGGALITHAIHAHDILMLAMGPVASVFARTATLVNDIETEDCAAAVLEMKSGALVTLSTTLGSEREISRLRLVYDGLVAESSLDPYNPGYEPWQFIAPGSAAQLRVDDALRDFQPALQRWVGQFALLHAALTEGTPLPVTLADARASLELLTAMYYSAWSGEPVPLPLPTTHPFHNGWTETLSQAASR